MLGKGLRLITNAADVGKKKVASAQASVEGDLVYPLLRGRDVGRWVATPSLTIILPHAPDRPGVGIPESTMKRSFRRAFDYYTRFRSVLEDRSGFKKYIHPAGGPFYAVYNIGSYTFAPYRVVWREQASSIEACVISTSDDGRHVIADHKLTLVGLETADEAYFLCGLLNSAPVRAAVSAYSIEIQISTHVCAFVDLPRFQQNDARHKQIARLSKECHTLARKGEDSRLAELEHELDQAACDLWGLTMRELKIVQAAARPRRGTAKQDETDEDGGE
jgi:hypothetical protein